MYNLVMKHCNKCDTTKSLDQFHRRGDKHKAWCKPCANAHNRERYEKDPARKALIRKHNKKNRLNNQKKLFQYLSKSKCASCGETNILTLQFDHLNNKKFEIGNQSNYLSWKTLKKEIDKCQVLCANCHSIKTATTNNNWKLKWLAQSDSN